MRRSCIFILAFALLPGLMACGTARPAEPTGAPTTVAQPATAAASKAAFERALELYKYFSMTSMQVDHEDTLEREGVTYYRVTDPEYPTMDALALALTEVFSLELTWEFLRRTVDGNAPLYAETDNYTKLYTCMGDRGATVSSYSVGAVSESDSKIVSKLTAVTFDGETRETLLTQELIDGKWVFTDFPLDW